MLFWRNRQGELIDTLWNVNEGFDPFYGAPAKLELIDTLWNVNNAVSCEIPVIN